MLMKHCTLFILQSISGAHISNINLLITYLQMNFVISIHTLDMGCKNVLDAINCKGYQNHDFP
ncbi:MAG: hypothetical protein A2503_08810 [Burkholderiales bacterium RIFOXYD12_FULL_59_19]|nr:MAG: hypothetical protein A2503_08810 [Burkholderiales bacterium RIFOXYD12_FULL_59_19]